MNRFAVGSGQTLFVQLVHNIVDDREGFFFVFDLCPKILKIGSNPLKSLPVFVEGVFRAGEIGRFRAIALWPGQQPVGGKDFDQLVQLYACDRFIEKRMGA